MHCQQLVVICEAQGEAHCAAVLKTPERFANDENSDVQDVLRSLRLHWNNGNSDFWKVRGLRAQMPGS